MPLRLPAVITLVPVPVAGPESGPEPIPAPAPAAWQGGPVELSGVVPPSGNMEVPGEAVLARHHAGRDDGDVLGQHRCQPPGRRRSANQSVRSHLSTADLARLAASGGRAAGPPPIPASEPGAAIEVDRIVARNGHVSLGGRYFTPAEILAGQMVSIRIEESILMFFDPRSRVDRETAVDQHCARPARERPGRDQAARRGSALHCNQFLP